MSLPEATGRVLAFTVTHGDRPFLADTIRLARGTAGYLVVLSGVSARQHAVAKAALEAEAGIQHLVAWPENRGQHHAFAEALALARQGGYRWLLRLDDDVRFKTKRWLKKLIQQTLDLRARAGDPVDRLVVAPKVIGLRNQPKIRAVLEKGQPYQAQLMELLGGVCRLHPVRLLDGFEPPLDEAIGRGDPEAIAIWCRRVGGLLVRFPNIRVVHRTDDLEAKDSPEAAHVRRMGWYWPWINPRTWS